MKHRSAGNLGISVIPSSGWLSVALAVSSFMASSPAQADVFSTWRRATIDTCQRLPTLEEVNALEEWQRARGLSRLPSRFENGAPGYDFWGVLEACTETETFAYTVGLALDDFTMPAPLLAPAAHLTIRANVFSDQSTGRSHYYWLFVDPNNKSIDCLANVNHTVDGNADDFLERAYEPWWLDTSGISEHDYDVDDRGRRYVWVCRYRSDEYRSSLVSQPAAMREYCKTNFTLPCSCGDRLQRCLPFSPFKLTPVPTSARMTRSERHTGPAETPRPDRRPRPVRNLGEPSARFPANDSEEPAQLRAPPDSGRYWLMEQLAQEGRRFVEYIVAHGRDFRDIFGTDYVVRTSRLQQFYDLLNGRADFGDCDKTVDIGQADECAIRRNLDPLLRAVTSGSYVPFHDDGNTPDWQVIPVPIVRETERGGLLTTFALMQRQPTEPNFANQVHSYSLCEDIGWREHPLDLAADSFRLGELGTFSPLQATLSANYALNDPNCVGCHLIVNPLGAFRNGYSTYGRYQSVPSDGIFLGQPGHGLVGPHGLGALLRESNAVTQCIANRSFHRLTGEYLPRNSSLLHELTTRFQVSGHNMRTLHMHIVKSDAYQRSN